MKIKKTLIALMMFMFCFCTMSFAKTSGPFTFTATKTSGRVASGETIKYTATTTDTSNRIMRCDIKIVDTDRNALVSTATNTPKNTNGVLTFNVNMPMPTIAYSNIAVTAKFTDKSNRIIEDTYHYTMNVEQKFVITPSKPNGSTVSIGEPIPTNFEAKQVGCGLKKVSYVMKDGAGNVLYQETNLTDDRGTGVGTALYKWGVAAPGRAYSTFTVTYTLEDIRGAKYNQTFTYHMNTGVSNVTATAEVQRVDGTIIPDGASVNTRTSAKMVMGTDSNKLGLSTIRFKITNTSTGEVVTDYQDETKNSVGSRFKYGFTFPKTAGRYKFEVRMVDMNGKVTEKVMYYTVTDNGTIDRTNTITITADKASGSSIPKDTVVTFTSKSSNFAAGVDVVDITVKNKATNAVVDTRHQTSGETDGAAVFNYNLKLSTVGTMIVTVKAKDIYNNEKTQTFEYNVTNSTINNSTKARITFDPQAGVELDKDDEIRILGEALTSTKVKTLTYKMYDANGRLLKENTAASSSASGSTSLAITPKVPTISTSTFYIDAKVVLIDNTEVTERANYYYGDSDDDNDDGSVHKGSIYSENDDLAIDLWLREKKRFYELDEEIDFVAYYYNSESKEKKNVIVEIEFPDEFKVKSVTPDQGTVKTKKDGTIKIDLGNVKSKTLGEIRFTLETSDDDIAEEESEIEATIYSDKDDEEDTSVQRIWIYENGSKGTRKAFVTGYTDGTFRPDDNITREEVAAMIARAFGYTASYSTRSFSDVKTNSWASKYIAGCVNKGIIKGYTDGTFRPYNNITRAELYAMAYRALGMDIDGEKFVIVPKKYKKETSWEIGYIAGLERLRMLEDMDDTDAEEYASRADVVYLISRVQYRNTSGFTVGTYSDLRSNHWCAKDIEAASYDYSYKRGSKGKEIVSSKSNNRY